MSVERTTKAVELTDLSTSRVQTADQCMLAFKYQYVQRLPAPFESASAMFGNVIHDGTMEWYGGEGPRTSDNATAHHDQSLVEIVKKQWPEATDVEKVFSDLAQAEAAEKEQPQYVKRRLPPKIWEMIQTLAELDEEREAVARAIQLSRPELKAPKQTKAFLESDAAVEFNEKLMALLDLSEKSSEIKWTRDENAYQAYTRSIEIAKRLEREWKGLPRPLLVEEPFRLDFNGVVLRGRIDQVRRDVLGDGTLLPHRIRDLKTGKNLMTQMGSFLQAFIYNEAVAQMDYEFLPEEVGIFDFFMVRHLDNRGRTVRQKGQIDRARHNRLALQILNGVAQRITGQHYEPHYGFWCSRCDFRSLCEQELNLWNGDGVEIEGITA